MKIRKENIILQAEVGSTAWGLSLDPAHSDSDQMGVGIEDFEDAMGVVEGAEQVVRRTAAERTGKDDARSEPGDIDLVVYTLRKWVRLALKGNPTVLTLLFAPQSSWISGDARGAGLQALAPLVASRQAGKAFLGYLQAQRARMLGEIGGLHGRLDTDEVKRIGYEPKFAMHMLRLGYQGIELLSTGRMSMPMSEGVRGKLLAVRRGEGDRQDVLTLCGTLERELKDLITESPLPLTPDTKSVEEWMLKMYWSAWDCEYGARFQQAYKEMKAKHDVVLS